MHNAEPVPRAAKASASSTPVSVPVLARAGPDERFDATTEVAVPTPPLVRAVVNALVVSDDFGVDGWAGGGADVRGVVFVATGVVCDVVVAGFEWVYEWLVGAGPVG